MTTSASLTMSSSSSGIVFLLYKKEGRKNNYCVLFPYPWSEMALFREVIRHRVYVENTVEFQLFIAFGQMSFLSLGISKTGDNNVTAADILLLCIVIGGPHHMRACSFSSQNAVLGILNDDDLLRLQSGTAESQVVDLGVGLFLADHIPCQHNIDLDICQDFFSDRFGSLFIGCGAHSNHQPGFHGLFHEAVDAWAKWELAGLH